MSLKKIAEISPEIEPKKFLVILKSIAERVEAGNNNCITLRECLNWGVSEEDAINGLFLLVRSGILRRKVALYDEEEDIFDDISDPSELKNKPIEDVRFWFYPNLNGDDFSPFFCNLTENQVSVEDPNQEKDTESEFSGPRVMQVFNQCQVSGAGFTDNSNNFSDINNSVVTSNGTTKISKSPINSGLGGEEKKAFNKSPWYCTVCFILFIISVLGLLWYSNNHEIKEQTAKIIRFALSFLLAFCFPLITDKSKLKGKIKWIEDLPLKFELIGGSAFFVISLLLFNYFKIPV